MRDHTDAKLAKDGYMWVAVNFRQHACGGGIPPGAVMAGKDHGYPSYVARVWHQGSWELGKLNSHRNVYYYPLRGEELDALHGEVLVAANGQSPVWINAAFGEDVQNVVSRTSVDHTQVVGRALVNGMWLPGKVVPSCRCIYIPYGCRALTYRKYQLLSTGFRWEDDPAVGLLNSSIVPLDSRNIGDGPNCLICSFQSTNTDPYVPKILVQSVQQESSWVVSGDGETLRHAVTNQEGCQLARVWVRGWDGSGSWSAGLVRTGEHPGVVTNCTTHKDYQVLVANREGADAEPPCEPIYPSHQRAFHALPEPLPFKKHLSPPGPGLPSNELPSNDLPSNKAPSQPRRGFFAFLLACARGFRSQNQQDEVVKTHNTRHVP